MFFWASPDGKWYVWEFPNHSAMASVFPVWIHSRAIELRVNATPSGSWHRAVRVPDGHVFRQGSVDSQTAAKVAAQSAFEERLQRASLNRYFPPGGYLWKQES